MKLALTGSSSSGKTTLIMSVLAHPLLANTSVTFCTTDARQLLQTLGHHSMDRMSRTEMREFQLLYYFKKTLVEEGQDNFVTDRSFVDVAAYWLERDAFDLSQTVQTLLTAQCRQGARKYDLHVYLPFGIIPFRSDGYRSEDLSLHRRIDTRIKTLLKEWNIKFIELATSNHQDRVDLVINRIVSLL
jgi:nicotinamide riboside kinase